MRLNRGVHRRLLPLLMRLIGRRLVRLPRNGLLLIGFGHWRLRMLQMLRMRGRLVRLFWNRLGVLLIWLRGGMMMRSRSMLPRSTRILALLIRFRLIRLGNPGFRLIRDP